MRVIGVIAIAFAARVVWLATHPRVFIEFLPDTSASRDPACANDTILDTVCVLELARGAGTVRLPPGSLVSPLGANPDGKHIVLEDSTVVDVWITEYPADGFTTSGGVGIDSTWRFDTTIVGRPATFTTLRLRSPVAAPEYVGLGFVTVDTVTAINFTVSTATPNSRDRALRAIASSISTTAR